MSLRNDVISSLGWLALGRLGGQVITWAITIVVVHILSPSAYGLLALAMMVVGFLSMFDELGMASALVQRRYVTDDLIRQVYGIVIVFNCILYGLVFFSAPQISTFFSEPRLTAVIRVLAVQLPLMSFALVPNAILRREMRFKSQSVVYFFATTLNSFCTLLLAWTGYGVWSLVAGSICAVLVRVIGFNVILPHRYLPKLSLAGMRQIVAFGSFVTLDRLLWYALTQLPVFIIGKFLGKEILGFFSVASQLSNLPTQKIAEMLNQVGFSAFSKIQGDIDTLGRHLLKAVRLLSFVGFPVFLGISSVAPELVVLFLGQRWSPVIVPLQVLSVTGMLGLLQVATKPAVMGVGRPDVGAMNLLVGGLVMLPALLIGVQWGLNGICVAYLIVLPLRFVITLRLYLAVLQVRMREYIRAMMPSFTGAALMYGVVDLLRIMMRSRVGNEWLIMATLVVGGAATYSAVMWFSQRETCREMLDLISRRTVGPELAQENP